VIRPSDDACIYVYRHAVDLRKAINGLVAIVESEMQLDPFTSVFCIHASFGHDGLIIGHSFG